MADTLATRMAFGQELIEIAKTNENFVVCNADTKTCGLEKFGQLFPGREFSFGIAEQNLVGGAAGLAACGNKVFLATFAVFASMRACEQVRTFVCYPKLNVTVIGTNVMHVGSEVGQGQAIKAINQLLVGVHMCATAEAFTMAKKCGVDLQTMYDVICKSAGRSEIFRNRGQFMIDRDFSTRSTLQIQLKDTSIACKTADAVGAPTLLGNTARELFKLAVRKYPPTDDSLEVVRIYEELCDGE